jgi:peptidoglycan/xylan/chitin deacetylase (PgdA/CDA1 family)
MSKIPILMYHSVQLVSKNTKMRSLHVPPRRFKFQMWLLKILGYKGLSLKDLRPYLSGDLDGKVVGITFDDGYKNNLINAAPILKKFNFTATCFLVSERIGSLNSWDIVKGIPKMPLMDEQEIQKWIEMGMHIGAHSKTHTDLRSLSKAEAENEIFGCKVDLESKFNISITDFCYPYGYFNDSIFNITKESGFLSASTMIRGHVEIKNNVFNLPRVPINHHTLPYLFLTKLMTSYEEKRK